MSVFTIFANTYCTVFVRDGLKAETVYASTETSGGPAAAIWALDV